MANNYNPYVGNVYAQELQGMRDRIDRQLQQLQQNQNQFMQPQQPQIQQTFQLSNPNQNNSEFDGKYVENIDEVKNTLVLKNSLFLNKDMSKLWFKDTGGTIRVFNLKEEIKEDENVAEINNLKKEINELKALLVQPIPQVQQVTNKIEEPVVGKIQPVTKIERKAK